MFVIIIDRSLMPQIQKYIAENASQITENV